MCKCQKILIITLEIRHYFPDSQVCLGRVAAKIISYSLTNTFDKNWNPRLVGPQTCCLPVEVSPGAPWQGQGWMVACGGSGSGCRCLSSTTVKVYIKTSSLFQSISLPLKHFFWQRLGHVFLSSIKYFTKISAKGKEKRGGIPPLIIFLPFSPLPLSSLPPFFTP